jgi:hypothetical protein
MRSTKIDNATWDVNVSSPHPSQHRGVIECSLISKDVLEASSGNSILNGWQLAVIGSDERTSSLAIARSSLALRLAGNHHFQKIKFCAANQAAWTARGRPLSYPYPWKPAKEGADDIGSASTFLKL